MSRHQINPEKLINSKWTAVVPADKEKHFLVTELVRDDQGLPVACILEAVYTRRESTLDWHELQDPARWLQGWK